MKKDTNNNKETELLDMVLNDVKFNLETESEDDNKLKEDMIKRDGKLDFQKYIFAKRLSSKIKDLGYTQENVASLSDLSKSTISNYCKGKRRPKAAELKALADVLHVTTDFLLGYSSGESFLGDSLERMTGISENALKNLYGISHNITEVIDINDDEPADINKSKMLTFSKFIEDFPNFYKFLIYLEQYKKIQKEVKKTDDIDEDTKDTLYVLERKLLETIKTF